MDEVRIASDQLSVVVARRGAELQSLRWRGGSAGTGSDGAGPDGTGPDGTGPVGTGSGGTGSVGTGSDGTGSGGTGPGGTGPGTDGGRELLWQAGPQWRRRAPTLFPVVGRVVDDEVTVDGRTYPMGQHGLVRDLDFDVLEASASRAVLRVTDDASTRAHYPFSFALVLAYAVEGASLTVRWTVSTTGSEPLPYSLGWHPAFRWPLVDGVPKEEHVVRFAEEEPAPVRRVVATLLAPEPRPTPVEGRLLRLSTGLFADDAVVLEDLRSRSVTFSGPGTPQVRLDLDGFPHLGVWSRPTGADFCCLEPWAGLPSPEGWRGELRDKPFGHLCPPGEVREASCTVTVTPPA